MYNNSTKSNQKQSWLALPPKRAYLYNFDKLHRRTNFDDSNLPTTTICITVIWRHYSLRKIKRPRRSSPSPYKSTILMWTYRSVETTVRVTVWLELLTTSATFNWLCALLERFRIILPNLVDWFPAKSKFIAQTTRAPNTVNKYDKPTNVLIGRLVSQWIELRAALQRWSQAAQASYSRPYSLPTHVVVRSSLLQYTGRPTVGYMQFIVTPLSSQEWQARNARMTQPNGKYQAYLVTRSYVR